MKYTIIISLILLCSFVKGRAQQSMNATIELQEATVQAYSADNSMPVTFINLDKKQIDLYNAGQEPSQILSNLPSITASSDAGNFYGYSYFRLRGIDQTRINMTLDGIPLNEPEDQGAYFSNFPDVFNSVQSVQIQRGVGTSANGVASFAGSLNLKSPNLTEENGGQVGANVGSYHTYRMFGEINRNTNNKSFYIRASALGSDGYKYHSGNKSYSGFYSGQLLLDKHCLKLVGFVGNQQNEMAWIGVSKEQIEANPRTNGNSEIEDDAFTQTLASVQHTFQINDHLTLNNTAYYNYLDGNYDFDLNNFLGHPSNNELYNYDFRSHFTGAFSNMNWYKNRWKINAGIHLNTYNRRHIGSEKTIGQLYQNTGYKNERSSFAKVRYSPNKWVLYADIQYRYSEFDYKGSVDMDKLHWRFINPKIGLVYNISSSSNVYYSFGRTGREPTRNDLFNGEDNLGTDENGIPLLNIVDAEYVNDHELGVRINKKRWNMLANVYFMDFENEIVLNGGYGPNGLPLHGSVAESFRSGLELDATIHLSNHLYLHNSSSFSHNRIKENGVEFEPILTPSIIVNQSIAYQKNRIKTALSMRYQSESFVDLANQYEQPSYVTLNWKAQYTYKQFGLSIDVYNITNKTVLTNGSISLDGKPLYFAQAPLHFNAGITWNF